MLGRWACRFFTVPMLGSASTTSGRGSGQISAGTFLAAAEGKGLSLDRWRENGIDAGLVAARIHAIPAVGGQEYGIQAVQAKRRAGLADSLALIAQTGRDGVGAAVGGILWRFDSSQRTGSRLRYEWAQWSWRQS